jgi:enterochelin esterase-like enzyme
MNECKGNAEMPGTDKHYRTLTNRESRAVAGLSMGGLKITSAG